MLNICLSIYHQLQNLCHTHPGAELLLHSHGFTASRSNVPACGNAVDLTIEQTINRAATTRGGIIGFSRSSQVASIVTIAGVLLDTLELRTQMQHWNSWTCCLTVPMSTSLPGHRR